ncbi:MAG: DNA topoisomerase IB, partial [Verrucomicrobiota bacterium]|nr:DNA topoisomerase IB [Verrucomicrobiota bacterium]
MTANLISVEPKKSAQSAGLRYVTDEVRGLHREKSGKNFCYFDAAGKKIREKNLLKRIKSLVIPPA